jgi:hypothetical protein
MSVSRIYCTCTGGIQWNPLQTEVNEYHNNTENTRIIEYRVLINY